MNVTAADGPRPFSIPDGSPLATGWRRTVADLLDRVGVHDLMDSVAAYAELRCRHEPDNCSAAEESAQGGWYRVREPALRRLEACALPPMPGRPRREEGE